MGIEENKEIVRKFFDEVVNKRDYSKADEFMAEDFNSRFGNPTVSGKEAHMQHYRYLHSLSSDLHLEINDMVAEENKVVVFCTWSGTHTGVLDGHPPTSKPFTLDMVGLWELRDRKLVKGRMSGNLLNFYKQLGITPSIE
jgi:steroid delta-isomerase-like uncharacterized protein